MGGNISGVDLIEVVGAPRSGSTLIFNIVGEFLQRLGIKFLPVPHEHVEASIRHTVMDGVGAVVAHHHAAVDHLDTFRSSFRRSRFIVPVRDMRETMFSMLQFGVWDVEHALQNAVANQELVRTLMCLPPDDTLIVEYERIESDLPGVVAAVADFLGYSFPPDWIAAVVAKYDKASVSRLIERIAAIPLDRVEALWLEKYGELKPYTQIRRERIEAGLMEDTDAIHEDVDPSPAIEVDGIEVSVVFENGRIVRLADPHTQFQSKHISKRDGRQWREALSPEEVERVERELPDWRTYMTRKMVEFHWRCLRLEENLLAAELQRDQLGEMVVTMAAERDQLGEELAAVAAQRDELGETVVTVAAERDQLGETLAVVTRQLLECQNELAAVAAQRDELGDLLAGTRGERDLLGELLAAARGQIEGMAIEMEALRATPVQDPRLAELAAELEAARAETASVAHERDVLGATLATTRGERDRLGDELAKALARLDPVRD